VPLGLEEGRVSLLARDGRLDGQLKLRGKRLGELVASLSAASSAAALIDRAGAMARQLKVKCPGSGLGGPLLGEGWQLGGRLAGDVRLAGTPAQTSPQRGMAR
jgi:hypothetical protein